MKKLHIALFAALWVGFFSLPILGTGCASDPSQRVQTVQTLKIVGQSAKSSMDAATQLLKQGAISVPQWQKVADIYDSRFQAAYMIAVTSAHADLSSVASPDLVGIVAELATLVAQLTTH